MPFNIIGRGQSEFLCFMSIKPDSEANEEASSQVLYCHEILLVTQYLRTHAGADLGGGCRGCTHSSPPR